MVDKNELPPMLMVGDVIPTGRAGLLGKHRTCLPLRKEPLCTAGFKQMQGTSPEGLSPIPGSQPGL